MDLNSRLGGCGICVIKGNFFRKYLHLRTKIRRTQKTELTLSLIHQIKLKLGGYSIWSASTSRTIYKERFGARAPHSHDAAKKVPRRPLEALDGLSGRSASIGSLEVLEAPDKRLQKHSTPAGLGYEELGGLSDPGQRDCP